MTEPIEKLEEKHLNTKVKHPAYKGPWTNRHTVLPTEWNITQIVEKLNEVIAELNALKENYDD